MGTTGVFFCAMGDIGQNLPAVFVGKPSSPMVRLSAGEVVRYRKSWRALCGLIACTIGIPFTYLISHLLMWLNIIGVFVYASALWKLRVALRKLKRMLCYLSKCCAFQHGFDPMMLERPVMAREHLVVAFRIICRSVLACKS
jgi:hypothetical protein